MKMDEQRVQYRGETEQAVTLGRQPNLPVIARLRWTLSALGLLEREGALRCYKVSWARWIILVSVVLTGTLFSDPALSQNPGSSEDIPKIQGTEVKCINPPPLFDVNQFPGPIKKTAAYVSRKLDERPSRSHRVGPEPRFVRWSRTRDSRCSFRILLIRSRLQAERSRQDGPSLGTMSQNWARASKVMLSDMASPRRTNSRKAFSPLFFTLRFSKKIHVITGWGKAPVRIG